LPFGKEEASDRQLSSNFEESTIVPIYKGQLTLLVRSEFFTLATWRSDFCVEVLDISEKCSAMIPNDQASHDKSGLLLEQLTLKKEALRSFETPESHSTDNTKPKSER
jgi:hypothetical protein